MIPGWGRSPGGGQCNPLQYSRLESLRDRGVWWATVHAVAKTRARLSDRGWCGSSSLPRGSPPGELSSGKLFSSLQFPWAPHSDGASRRRAGLWARGLSICFPCRIFSQQGWNPWPLSWWLHSYPGSHQGNLVAALVPPVSFPVLFIWVSGCCLLNLM